MPMFSECCFFPRWQIDVFYFVAPDTGGDDALMIFNLAPKMATSHKTKRGKKKILPEEPLRTTYMYTNHMDLFNSRPIRSRSFSESNLCRDGFVKLCHNELLTLTEFPANVDYAIKPFRLRSSYSESHCDPIDFMDLEFSPGSTRLDKYNHYLKSRDKKIRGRMKSHKKKKDYALCIQELPAECKIKIFSYLGCKQRGLASRVCHEWYDLMKVTLVWSSVDFTEFELCDNMEPGHQCTEMCYVNYQRRVKHFFCYLVKMKPILKSLRLEFDIDNKAEQWLEHIDELLRASNCRELSHVYFNWTETPARPFWLDQVNHTVSNYSDFISKFRHRQRVFVHFFDFFTSIAPRITSLVIPFDWSVRSVQCMGRLVHLDTLVLEKYSVFQSLKQEFLTALLNQLQALKRLVLEVWIPSGAEMTSFTLSSQSIEYLDISQSRGFYISHVKLPQLRVLKAKRQPYKGPLDNPEYVDLPCLYVTLTHGAKNLKVINQHTLSRDWHTVQDEALIKLIQSLCCCKIHRSEKA